MPGALDRGAALGYHRGVGLFLAAPRLLVEGGLMSKRTRKRRWRLKKNRANHGRHPA
ncbi:hypothetical protein [Streptomyces sp. UNOC14_S4]|uniref:hypothetical protein n=1 Tax=Streptomyces sp. UNOC14_S4 TaxID=2872340 RepID=UPI001E45C0B2|nr:hypothetical protein [Streptomyces sp. UNOC14_S4]MCC3769775.1 hypothetical protein [Streptomyces sp. UNOC14_S4]